MIDFLKILNIYNQTLSWENNNVRCLSKTQINDHFIFGLCYLRIEKQKILQILLAVINNEYTFLVVIDVSTLK
jgi:hypothetical protein